MGPRLCGANRIRCGGNVDISEWRWGERSQRGAERGDFRDVRCRSAAVGEGACNHDGGHGDKVPSVDGTTARVWCSTVAPYNWQDLKGYASKLARSHANNSYAEHDSHMRNMTDGGAS